MKRIVAGRVGDGSSVILDRTALPPGGGTAMSGVDVWITDGTPPSLELVPVPDLAEPVSVEPPPAGSAFRVVEFPPGASSGTHASETLDYVVVVRGEIVLVVGTDEVVLGPGDVVVQAGASHNWVNRSQEPCLMAAVLLRR